MHAKDHRQVQQRQQRKDRRPAIVEGGGIVLPREIIPKTHGVCRAPSAPAATPTPTAVPAVAATAGQLMAASRGTTAAWERRSSELRAPNEAQAAATTATSRQTNSTATADIDRARARTTRYSDRRADNATTATTATATAATTTTSRSRPTQLNRSQTPHAKPATTNPRTAQKDLPTNPSLRQHRDPRHATYQTDDIWLRCDDNSDKRSDHRCAGAEGERGRGA